MIKHIRVPRFFKLNWDTLVGSDNKTVGAQVWLRFRPHWNVYTASVCKGTLELSKREWRGKQGWTTTKIKAVEFR